MTTVYVLVMIIVGSQGTAAITTQEFNSETTCKMAEAAYKQVMEQSWKSYDAYCVQK